MSGQPSLVEDAVHEVFLRIWQKRASYQPTAKFLTYLFTIVKNHWFNEAKRLKKKPVTFSVLDQKTDSQPALDITTDPTGEASKNLLKRE
ncbi:MAG: sigma-70 family RNA polymerase sigma factor [Planctomycetes bacterium]|nr:sigma-70 family RNA polymerase sigma factor [Planctomycetota bacterium]